MKSEKIEFGLSVPTSAAPNCRYGPLGERVIANKDLVPAILLAFFALSFCQFTGCNAGRDCTQQGCGREFQGCMPAQCATAPQYYAEPQRVTKQPPRNAVTAWVPAPDWTRGTVWETETFPIPAFPAFPAVPAFPATPTVIEQAPQQYPLGTQDTSDAPFTFDF